jgi:murein DD-endopeptidase MepM/ murein hydrolase activator NlpD
MKSTRRSFTLVFVGLVMLLAPISCSQSYSTSLQLTETARAALSTEIPPTLTSTVFIPSYTPTSTYTPIPTSTLPPTITPPSLTPSATQLPPYPSGTKTISVIYYSQSGDTLPAVALRFNVKPEEIASEASLPATGLIEPMTLLIIPNRLTDFGPAQVSFPDSEVVFSPAVLDFNTHDFLSYTSGYLKTYKEYVMSWLDSSEVVDKVATDNSINPRLLLAILDFQSHWVSGFPTTDIEKQYPMGLIQDDAMGLYQQLKWVVSELSIGYYGWRAGILTSVILRDGTKVHLAPNLNAGTAAIQVFFGQIAANRGEWEEMLQGDNSFTKTYEALFGEPWLKAFEPLYPTNLTQPTMELPFLPGQTWANTGGPHSAWGVDGALAALDFAPPTDTHGCKPSDEWVVASAPGLVVRSGNGVVIEDLDGDGYEETGWDIMYLHMATDGRVPVGTYLNVNDRIGHPSCEGGDATGSHLHLARKFNGEWILADGAVPFVLSGWTAHFSGTPYVGTLTKNDQIVISSMVGEAKSLVTRPDSP